MENNQIDINYLVLMHCRKNIELAKIISVKKYINIEDKINYIDDYCKKIIIDKKFNSIDKYVYGILLIISIYTNLNIKGTYSEFDILESNNLIGEIIELIDEYDSFRQYLEARFQDYLRDGFDE